MKHGGGKKCSYSGCEKVSRGRTQFCAAVSQLNEMNQNMNCKIVFTECSFIVTCTDFIVYIQYIYMYGNFYRCMYAQHGGGVRCKLAGCNRVAIGKVQLCRAHGGGARPKDTHRSFSAREVRIPMASSIGAASGSSQGTFCVPIIEPIMDGYERQQQQQQQAHAVGADLASI